MVVFSISLSLGCILLIRSAWGTDLFLFEQRWDQLGLVVAVILRVKVERVRDVGRDEHLNFVLLLPSVQNIHFTFLISVERRPVLPWRRLLWPPAYEQKPTVHVPFPTHPTEKAGLHDLKIWQKRVLKQICQLKKIMPRWKNYDQWRETAKAEKLLWWQVGKKKTLLHLFIASTVTGT